MHIATHSICRPLISFLKTSAAYSMTLAYHNTVLTGVPCDSSQSHWALGTSANVRSMSGAFARLIVILVLSIQLNSSAQSTDSDNGAPVSKEMSGPLPILLTNSPEIREWPTLLRLAKSSDAQGPYTLLRLARTAVEPIGECNTETSCKLLVARSRPLTNTAADIQSWLDTALSSPLFNRPTLIVVDRSLPLTVDHPTTDAARMPLGQFSDSIKISRRQQANILSHSNQRDLAPAARSLPKAGTNAAHGPVQLTAINLGSFTPIFRAPRDAAKGHLDADPRNDASDIKDRPRGPALDSDSCALLVAASAARPLPTPLPSVDSIISCWRKQEISDAGLVAMGKRWFDEQYDRRIVDLAVGLSQPNHSLSTALTILYDTVLSGSNFCPGESLVRRLFEINGYQGLDHETGVKFAHCKNPSSMKESTAAQAVTETPAVAAGRTVPVGTTTATTASLAKEVDNSVTTASSTWLRQASAGIIVIGDVATALKASPYACHHCSSVIEHIAFHGVLAQNDGREKRLLSDLITVQSALLTAKELGYASSEERVQHVGAKTSDSELCKSHFLWDSILCSKGANGDMARQRYRNTFIALLGRAPEDIVKSIAQKGYIVFDAGEHSVNIKNTTLHRLVGDGDFTGYSRAKRVLEVLESDLRGCLTVLLSKDVPSSGLEQAIEVVLDEEDVSAALSSFRENSHLALMNWVLVRDRSDGTSQELIKQSQVPCVLSQRNAFKCLLRQPLEIQRRLWASLQQREPASRTANGSRSAEAAEVTASGADTTAGDGMTVAKREFQRCIQEWSVSAGTAEDRAVRSRAVEGYEEIVKDLSPSAFILLRKVIRFSSSTSCADERLLRVFQLISLNDSRRVDIAALALIMIGRIESAEAIGALDSILAKIILLSDEQAGELMKVLACAHCGGIAESERRELSAFFIEVLDGIPEYDSGYRVEVNAPLAKLLGHRRTASVSTMVTTCLKAHSWESVWLDDLFAIDSERALKSLVLRQAGTRRLEMLPERLLKASDRSRGGDQPLKQSAAEPFRARTVSERDLEGLSLILDSEVVSEGKALAQLHDRSAFSELVLVGARSIQGDRAWNDWDHASGIEPLPLKLELLQWRCLQADDVQRVSVGLLLHSLRQSNGIKRSTSTSDGRMRDRQVVRYWLAHLASIVEGSSEDALFKVLSFLIWRK